jgi:hypothetical protein
LLADRQDHDTDLSEGAAPTSERPAAQQQQQIQPDDDKKE